MTKSYEEAVRSKQNLDSCFQMIFNYLVYLKRNYSTNKEVMEFVDTTREEIEEMGYDFGPLKPHEEHDNVLSFEDHKLKIRDRGNDL